ncbi:MAG: NAD(P)H-dependent oxidoreductase subunit E, partial [Egibacteraceae bacterium]
MDIRLRQATPTDTERAAIDLVVGAGPTGQGFEEPPTGQGFGEPPTGQGFGEPPTGQGLGEPPTGQGFGETPTGQGFGETPTGQGFGETPTGQGFGETPISNGRAVQGGRRARARRHLLLPALHAVQDAVGWISEGALSYICERLVVPPADAYGVATFYAMFSLSPRAPRVAHVCDDLACRMAGAEALCDTLAALLGPETSGEAVTWVRSPCLGLCERAPAVLFQLAGDADWSLAPAAPADVVAGLAGDADWPLAPAAPADVVA